MNMLRPTMSLQGYKVWALSDDLLSALGTAKGLSVLMGMSSLKAVMGVITMTAKVHVSTGRTVLATAVVKHRMTWTA